MPIKDTNHDIVVRALTKAGWSILKEQKYLSIGKSNNAIRRLYIDIQAQHESHDIVLIEVKGLESSPVHGLMELLGQYLVYRGALDYLKDNTPLYVAIPKAAYDTVMQHPMVEQVLQKNPIPFVIYDPTEEEILAWIPPL